MLHETNENDPELIKFVKSIIIPPSAEPLNLDDKTKKDYSQYGQSSIIDKLLESKKKGFIVEAGAFDGFFQKRKSNDMGNSDDNYCFLIEKL